MWIVFTYFIHCQHYIYLYLFYIIYIYFQYYFLQFRNFQEFLSAFFRSKDSQIKHSFAVMSPAKSLWTPRRVD